MPHQEGASVRVSSKKIGRLTQHHSGNPYLAVRGDGRAALLYSCLAFLLCPLLPLFVKSLCHAPSLISAQQDKSTTLKDPQPCAMPAPTAGIAVPLHFSQSMKGVHL